MILEPFFGDNEESLKFSDPGKYADVLAKILIMANSPQLKTNYECKRQNFTYLE